MRPTVPKSVFGKCLAFDAIRSLPSAHSPPSRCTRPRAGSG
jgi:hypothetical protein